MAIQISLEMQNPLAVKVFTYLMIQGKILTRDVLRSRGMNLLVHCEMCRNCPVESILYLIYLYPYALSVMFEVARMLDCALMTPTMTVQEVWEKSWDKVQEKGKIKQQKWMMMFICVAWNIWKQRNAVVFGE